MDREVLAELDVHLTCDNYATHKTATVEKWLLAHPRCHMHFTPTGSPRRAAHPWLNLVERWFAELATKRIRRGVHKSVQGLEKDIRTWNDSPYVWTSRSDENPRIPRHILQPN